MTYTTDTIISLADHHSDTGPMASSAKVALADARKLAAKGEHYLAKRRALDSLRYSVGVFHKTYRVVDAAIV